MRKFFSLVAIFIAMPLFADPSAKLNAYEFFTLGMNYDSLRRLTPACDALADSPGFTGSMEQGVASTICPATQTFGLATFIDNKMAVISVNWVSWDAKILAAADKNLIRIPAALRQKYGIPNATIPYESEFGNSEADKFCSSEGKCRIHIWRAERPARVASLVFAVRKEGEIPLIFHLADLDAEQRINQLKNKNETSISKREKRDGKMRL